MGAYTNLQNIPLSVAVWLAHDEYDYDDRNNHISATSLLKSIRQIVLSTRVKKAEQTPDISGLIPSTLGTAIHNGIEHAWVKNYKDSLLKLGVSKRVINRVKINPLPSELDEDCIPVYLEQRAEKEIMGFIVSGKFDFIAEGRLEDFKSTSTYTYQFGTKDDDYSLQGSIYRWLNPDKITQDEMAIQFIFTDWSASKARVEKDKGYPSSRIMEYKIPLKSIAETEAWIKNKLTEVRKYLTAPEETIPECSDKELWRKDPVFKYYKNPEKMTRSTKNFTNISEAQLRMAQDGGVGIIVEQKGTVGACRYCDSFDVCTQKDKYIESGELVLN
ncbi:MAG: hypothetical protein ACRBB6_04110 [Neptuniibacter sp.]